MEFLKVRGTDIVTPTGRPVKLRGYCLGGYMLMENFINGFPGCESAFRSAVAKVLGQSKADFFFNTMLDYFITEEDIRFLASLGATVVRIPLNYRHFEDDARPFEYKDTGIKRVDKALAWCEKHNVYAILDLHAAQGWQSRDWHCDNPTPMALLYDHPHFQERAIALWKHFAGRYKDRAVVAGYNIINEPDAADPARLNAFYRNATAAIREIDTEHILYLEGNIYSTDFEVLEPPFDANTAYSSHNYVIPGFGDGPYPGVFRDVHFNREKLEKEYLQRADFMKRHQVPAWVGEFGSVFFNNENDPCRLKVMEDMIDIMEGQGHHWTLWTYKDLGLMAPVYIDPESEWMKRIRPVLKKKEMLCADVWPSRSTPLDAMNATIIGMLKDAGLEKTADDPWFSVRFRRLVRGLLLSEPLIQPFAEQFRGMTETQIDTMMQSFAFKNCLKRGILVDSLKKKLAVGASAKTR